MQYVQNRIHAYKPGLSVPYDTAPLKQPQPMALFVLLSSLGWTVVTLLSGCPQYLLDKQETVQNAAARLVEKSDHIHPTLQALHWLPVQTLSTIDSVLFLAHPLNICLRAVTIGIGHPTLCRASCKHRNVSLVFKKNRVLTLARLFGTAACLKHFATLISPPFSKPPQNSTV